MKKLLHGLAALPFLAAGALAQPMQLTDKQMDKVNAGFSNLEIHNTGLVAVSLWFSPYLTEKTGNSVKCDTCYLLIVGPRFSIASQIGHPTTFPTFPAETGLRNLPL